ncbi:1-(5-phosphoribosyl)-5-[(5-phosphoribosylamino)methylideneamino] imidazole-4-carboxamide isomerase [Buchnera aphidicola (Cinara cuneomaculata)]|uniref:1-(5-phosphoribosyl)-5-[(5-phosphoribosylamino)methylideneamino] imidazole-4-carboxamide isomerase n=1 Tax=Buchnera aphidicola (Cinara cuneomaculata) TaxID=1660040 RepID=A0A451CXL0_9GAMM|nr:1-(5-phosphoribosyl)-5-[(5-phosphoribosylamino)methylideneamino] imidazole-4-carboxamide isomerase [Buchnera aphidicola]VFP78054.1 1-(5-phosphoribosyl)-5-[(5-phosphoribosylamino)methylideneamino] imidazole-4-carboxamide isomerase [Buchnera aphidicola (Cinara cuneomaculata)]
MIIPSLDFIQGKTVRLYQGNYNCKTRYNINIFEQIDEYICHGATHIHLVDLDGCSNPLDRQKNILKIVSNYKNITFQVGGGIRTHDDIKSLLDVGVNKIVIGTVAILYPNKFKRWLSKYGGDKLILAVDIKVNNKNENKIAINGWKVITQSNIEDIVSMFVPYGLKNILCTDILRDGTFLGPNVELYKHLKKQFPNIILQSSGGVCSIADICSLQEHNVEHVIIGRALLEKKFTFLEARQCWQKELSLV